MRPTCSTRERRWPERGRAKTMLVAKLERPEAIAHLDEVLSACDAVMVARGDLGLGAAARARAAGARRSRARLARAAFPVIVATQVLESMRTEPRPTRAEVSDAANAVGDGVDAIMLAGETASGTVSGRRRRDARCGSSTTPSTCPPARCPRRRRTCCRDLGRALCEAAVTLAGSQRCRRASWPSRAAARRRACSRPSVPHAPIYAATDGRRRRQTTRADLGVVPLVGDLGTEVEAAIDAVAKMPSGAGVVPPGSVVVIVSISPDLAPGPSNFLKLERI